MNYDKNNIFAKILRGDIPCTKVFENEYSLAFKDISPQAKIHVLVIPKGAYTDIDDFYTNASEKEIISFSNAVREVLMLTGVSQNSGGKGFRAIANTGPDGIQEVPHFHLHILGGENLGLRGLRKA
ncbi:MAG: histidine triad nucleotide-binding protein [Candidatus Pelagibacter sp.]|nr:histidine triad nucleotide-binding protein [Candidatus Pelagibacter sp.]OUV98450.1 MAG: histidine triad nucleotide-binding protein [Candidatus Pelagibacter sp. TMED142]